jgi:hypothetical protein
MVCTKKLVEVASCTWCNRCIKGRREPGDLAAQESIQVNHINGVFTYWKSQQREYVLQLKEEKNL